MNYIKAFENFNNGITINEIVVELFKARDLAHQSHLATSKYSAHKALETFYEEIVELLDKLVETWQGTVGEKIQYDLNYTNILPESDVDRLTKLGQKINLFSSTLAENFSHIKNILDEILDLINQTVYKLKFLVEKLKASDFEEESLSKGHPSNVEYNLEISKHLKGDKLFSCHNTSMSKTIRKNGKVLFDQDYDTDDSFKIFKYKDHKYAVTKDGVIYVSDLKYVS